MEFKVVPLSSVPELNRKPSVKDALLKLKPDTAIVVPKNGRPTHSVRAHFFVEAKKMGKQIATIVNNKKELIVTLKR